MAGKSLKQKIDQLSEDDLIETERFIEARHGG